MPYFSATLRSVSITSMLWSQARFSSSNCGASSNCAGATSLWRVLAGMPSFQSSRSTSFMKDRTRSGTVPK